MYYSTWYEDRSICHHGVLQLSAIMSFIQGLRFNQRRSSRMGTYDESLVHKGIWGISNERTSLSRCSTDIIQTVPLRHQTAIDRSNWNQQSVLDETG